MSGTPPNDAEGDLPTYRIAAIPGDGVGNLGPMASRGSASDLGEREAARDLRVPVR